MARAQSRQGQIIGSFEIERTYADDWDTVDSVTGRVEGPTEADYLLAVQVLLQQEVETWVETHKLGVSGRLFRQAVRDIWLRLVGAYRDTSKPAVGAFANSRNRQIKLRPARVDGLIDAEPVGTSFEFFTMPPIAAPDLPPVTREAYFRVVSRLGADKMEYVAAAVHRSETEASLNLAESETPGTETPRTETRRQCKIETPPNEPVTPPDVSAGIWGPAPKSEGRDRKRMPGFLGLKDRLLPSPSKRKKLVMSPWMSKDGSAEVARNPIRVPLSRLRHELRIRGLTLSPYVSAVDVANSSYGEQAHGMVSSDYRFVIQYRFPFLHVNPVFLAFEVLPAFEIGDSYVGAGARYL
eukprot:Gregarina_sp_Poly_1__11322@NODE_948_length_5588_cov_118_430538_g672_i0_p3_GENE_NODE_948_length_5588_cov_118_430538_g672_i0NODE_948_length_5588_cov_118_430538_g672_i0_p3_ORF_typecomplete_len353_score44_64_NODE_948_length_5588_cov_118_430538_g672_i041965254